MRATRCPHHPVPMDVLWLAPENGGNEIEIDRCSDCGALWFDLGELEKSVNLRAKPTHSESELDCPVCRQRMAAATLPDGAFAHHCRSCQGVLIDPIGIAVLDHPRLPRPPGSKPSRTGFLCVKCDHRFPYAQGNGTNLGLMCRGCVANPQVERLPERRGSELALNETDLLSVVSSVFFFSDD